MDADYGRQAGFNRDKVKITLAPDHGSIGSRLTIAATDLPPNGPARADRRVAGGPIAARPRPVGNFRACTANGGRARGHSAMVEALERLANFEIGQKA